MRGALRSVSVVSRKPLVDAVTQPRQPVAKRKVGKCGGMEKGGIEGEKKSENVSEARKRGSGLTVYTAGVVSMEKGLNSLVL